MLYTFFKFLCKVLKRNNRYIEIMTRDGKNIYMLRHILLKTKYFSVYIHRFLRSDEGDHHTHPWPSASYLIKGGYTEEYLLPEPKRGLLKPHTKRRNQGTFRYMPISHIHKVQLDKEYSYEEREDAPLTLFITGPRKRIWGFIKNASELNVASNREGPHGHTWINWKDYLGIDENDPRFYGSE